MFPWIKQTLTKSKWISHRTKPEPVKQNIELDYVNPVDSKIPIKILSKSGLITLHINVTENFNAKTLKQKALKELFPCEENLSSDFVLIRIKSKARLHDLDKLNDVKKNEEFLLVSKRAPPKTQNHEFLRGPSNREIFLKTNYLPTDQGNVNSLNILQNDLQHDLRQLIISIANESVVILSKTAYATKLINYFRQKILFNFGEMEANLLFSKQKSSPTNPDVMREIQNIDDLKEIIKFYNRKYEESDSNFMDHKSCIRESEIIQVLMSSPQIQLTLGNPKMFIAYLSILENSSNLNIWLSDSDFSPLLNFILRTYHEQKNEHTVGFVA